MPIKESKFEKACINKLRKLPYSYWPPKGEPGSTRGMPDRLGCIRGRFCALEFKRSMRDAFASTNRKRLQEYTVNQVQEAGGFGSMVYPENWEMVFQQLKEMAYGVRETS
jgi:hypothetical protein